MASLRPSQGRKLRNTRKPGPKLEGRKKINNNTSPETEAGLVKKPDGKPFSSTAMAPTSTSMGSRVPKVTTNLTTTLGSAGQLDDRDLQAAALQSASADVGQAMSLMAKVGIRPRKGTGVAKIPRDNSSAAGGSTPVADNRTRDDELLAQIDTLNNQLKVSNRASVQLFSAAISYSDELNANHEQLYGSYMALKLVRDDIDRLIKEVEPRLATIRKVFSVTDQKVKQAVGDLRSAGVRSEQRVEMEYALRSRGV